MYQYDPAPGDASVGSITISSQQIYFILGSAFESSWRIEGLLEKEFTSEWSTGEGDYYWYRIEGTCGEMKCDIHGIEYPDCRNVKFFTVVAARNVGEVCDLLKSPKYTAPVNLKLSKVERYSRPVAKENIIEGECNILEQQEFCQIAECLDYCVDEDVVVFFNIKTRPIEFIFEYQTQGSLSISGNVAIGNYYEYNSNIDDISFISLNGSSDLFLKIFHENSASGLSISSKIESISNRYNYTPQGFIELGGISRSISSSKTYDYLVKLNLSGSSKATRVIQGFGSLSIDNESDIFVKYFPRPSGFINLDGVLQDKVSPNYSYSAVGNVVLDGSASLNFSNLGVIVSLFSFNLKAFDFKLEEKEIEYGTNLSIADAIAFPICGCGPLGMSILLSHNINNSSVLGNFFKRNVISTQNKVNLKYKAEDDSWRSIQHFTGRSRDGVSFEDWTIFLTLQCMSGSDAWRFSFIVKSQNRTTNQDLQTKFLIDMPANLICFDDNISTNIRTYIGTNQSQVTKGQATFVTSPSRSLVRNYRKTTTMIDGVFNDYLVYYDDLGLFKDSYWINNPVEFNISPISRAEMPTTDLQSIFQSIF